MDQCHGHTLQISAYRTEILLPEVACLLPYSAVGGLRGFLCIHFKLLCRLVTLYVLIYARLLCCSHYYFSTVASCSILASVYSLIS